MLGSDAGDSHSIASNNHQLLAQNSKHTAAKRKRQASESRSLDRSKQRAMNLTLGPLNPSPSNAPQMLAMQKQLSECDQNAHKALVEKLLHEMAAANRAKNAQETHQRMNNEALHRYRFTSLPSGPMQAFETRNDDVGSRDISSAASSSAHKTSSDELFRRNCDYPVIESSNAKSSAIARKVASKAEPCSPQESPEAYQSPHEDLSGVADYYW